MKTESYYRQPAWYEKKVLICKNCGLKFFGVKILFVTKCPRCGSRNVIENPLIHY